MLAAVAAVVVARDLAVGEQVDEPALIDLLACGGIALLGMAAGSVALWRSRHSGALSLALVGWGLVVFAVLAVGIGGLLDQLVSPPDTVVGGAGLAGRAAAIGLFAAAVVLPAVDTRLRFWSVAAFVLVASGALFGALFIVMGRLEPGTHLIPAWGVLLAVVWFALATLYRTSGAQTWTFAWCALGFVGLGVSRLLQALLEPGGGHLPGSLTVQLVGMACALYGITRDLQIDLVRSRVELDLIRTSEGEAEERARRMIAERQLLGHEVRNALLAIGGATSTLERYRDRLDPATVAALSDGVAREVARLHAVFDQEPGTSGKDGLHPSSSSPW